MRRLRTKKFFHTFYLMVIAVLVTLLVVERQVHRDTITLSQQAWQEQHESAQQALEENLHKLQDSLQADLVAIKASLSRHSPTDGTYPKTRPASAEQPPLNSITNPDTPNVAAGDGQPADPKRLNQGPTPVLLDNTDAKHLNGSERDDFNADQELFALQSVDPDWAYPTRERIEQLFAHDDYLRELQLIEVDCRSSICRIDLGEPDPIAIDPARVLQALRGFSEASEPAQFQLSSQPQEFGYRIYIERDD